jgi:hypothetical protein
MWSSSKNSLLVLYVDSNIKSHIRQGDEIGREMKETHSEAMDEEQ